MSKLSAIKCIGKDAHRHELWLFQCACGNISTQRINQVKLGKVKSCGCILRENMKTLHTLRKKGPRLPNNGAAKNRWYRLYKINARKRHLTFELPFDIFVELILQDCHYCGVMAMLPSTNSFYNMTPENTIMVNGIDRKNNNVGYTVENSVTCCTRCNKMKLALGYEVFLEHIKAIYNHRIK